MLFRRRDVYFKSKTGADWNLISLYYHVLGIDRSIISATGLNPIVLFILFISYPIIFDRLTQPIGYKQLWVVQTLSKSYRVISSHGIEIGRKRCIVYLFLTRNMYLRISGRPGGDFHLINQKRFETFGKMWYLKDILNNFVKI